MSGNADASFPVLQEGLRDKDPEALAARSPCPGPDRPPGKGAVPDLVKAIHDEAEPVREAAILALGEIGPDAAEAVPALMRSPQGP